MAKKETFYFSHDHNARNDRKIAPLVKEYKSAGYGIYWCTAEMMHEEGGELDFDDITIESISKDLNEDFNLVKEVIEKCISTFKLFVKVEDKITAGRVKRNLSNIDLKSKSKSEAGRLGGIKSAESRRTKQNEAVLEANEAVLEANELKEKKRKEKKVNEIKIINNEQSPFLFELMGLGKMSIQAYSNCEQWQYKELKDFVTNSQSNFESLIMSNQILNNNENFKIAVQQFVNMIQTNNDYQESSQLRRFFGNWISKKNGSLEMFINGFKRCVGSKKTTSSFI